MSTIAIPPSSDAAPAPSVRIPLWRSLVFLALVLATVAVSWHRSDAEKTSEPGVIMRLPDRVGEFTGKDESITEAERVILPKDTELVRKTYTNPAGDQISQTIVLSGGEKRSIHRPEICLPGQGWTISGQETIPVTLDNGRKMEVVNLTLVKEQALADGRRVTLRGYFMYWFVGKDRTTSSQFTRIMLTAMDRLRENKNHRWAYVIVSGLITENLRPGGRNAQDTVTMAKEFIRESVPAFQKMDMPPAAVAK